MLIKEFYDSFYTLGICFDFYENRFLADLVGVFEEFGSLMVVGEGKGILHECSCKRKAVCRINGGS